MRVKKRTIGLSLLLLPMLFFASLYLPFPKEKLNPAPLISLRLTDRNNSLLREILSDGGGRCRWVRLDEISPYLIKATIASEDSHYFLHSGVNFFSVIRALWQNLKHREVISGASTISQQLVRNIYHGRRTLFSKIREAWLALRLERTLDKTEILVQYLNRISYGNQAFGIEAAARLYFDKPSFQLDLAESAFLAGLPRSPTQSNPYRSLSISQNRQKDILKRMRLLGFISKPEMERAVEEKLKLVAESGKFRAPHFCDFVLEQVPPARRQELGAIRTTIDFSLQEKVETLLRNHLRSLEKMGISNGAVVVLDNATGDILSLVGSKDFFDEAHDGQVDGALSPRQPGSTLKPFTYALALEKGLTAASILEDVPTQFVTLEGIFIPQNYDRRYHGPIRLRSALACSYNIPAVSILQAIGSDILFQRLKSLGFESLNKSPEFYGIGLTLGNGEVTLLELARAYAALSRGGIFFRENSVLQFFDPKNRPLMVNAPPEQVRVFSPQVAFLITHILEDHDARVPAFGYNSPLNLPFPVAAKTGTSKDFRDNWTLGYSARATVGVWVGNFNGEPMHNVSGISGCGPLFRDIMVLLHQGAKSKSFEEPRNIIHLAICPISGQIATASCPGKIDEVFVSRSEPHGYCDLHQLSGKQSLARNGSSEPISRTALEVVFPQEGDIFKIDPILRREFQILQFRAAVPQRDDVERVEWWVNGRKIGERSTPFTFSWILRPGSYTIKATARAKEKKLESRPVKISVVT